MSCGKPHEVPCTEVLALVYSYIDGELETSGSAQDQGTTSRSADRACGSTASRELVKAAGAQVLRPGVGAR